MADKNVILLSTIRVDNYVKSFFKTFNSVGYTSEVAKQVERAMFEYFNKYVAQRRVKEFKLERYGVGLFDSENGKIFVKLGSEEAESTKAAPPPAGAGDQGIGSGSLLALERSRVDIKFTPPES